jgi:hypothetical protein
VLDALALQPVAVDKGRTAATLPCGSWIGRVASYAKAVLAREVIALMAHGTEVRSSTLVPLLARKAQEDPLRYEALYETFRLRLWPGPEGVSLLDIVRKCTYRTSSEMLEAVVHFSPALDLCWRPYYGHQESMMGIVYDRSNQAAQLAAMPGPRGLPAPYGRAGGEPRNDVVVLNSGELRS